MFLGPEAPESVLEFITPLPKEENVCIGDKLELKAVIAAKPPPEVTWLIEEDLLEESERYRTEFDGETAKLVIENVTDADDAVFTCIAENEVGTIECSCDLLVTESQSAPKFVKPVESVTVLLDNEAEFSVQVEGNPEPEVKWFLNEKLLKDRGRFQLIKEKDSRYVFVLGKCKQTDSGIVKCVAKNDAGEVSCTANIVITEQNSAPVLKEITESVCEFLAGSDARLEVLTSGNPEPTVNWLKGFKRLVESKDKYEVEKTQNKNVLIIKNLKLEDAGTYKCLASNQNGDESLVFTVKVKGTCYSCSPSTLSLVDSLK